LLQETAEGAFVLRSERYYREFWQRFSQAGVGQMFLAHRDGALVAGAYAMALGAKTTYKDGASMRAKTAYGASHALQWEVMRWANERGALVHDLCGAPPSDRADDREHPLFGVGQFKRSFSPQIVDYAGAFDLPLRPLAYRIWEVGRSDRATRLTRRSEGPLLLMAAGLIRASAVMGVGHDRLARARPREGHAARLRHRLGRGALGRRVRERQPAAEHRLHDPHRRRAQRRAGAADRQAAQNSDGERGTSNKILTLVTTALVVITGLAMAGPVDRADHRGGLGEDQLALPRRSRTGACPRSSSTASTPSWARC
ncbi:lipid II:glycine glycyltransferase FemX, partial [Leucobacter chromiiresistens]